MNHRHRRHKTSRARWLQKRHHQLGRIGETDTEHDKNADGNMVTRESVVEGGGYEIIGSETFRLLMFTAITLMGESDIRAACLGGDLLLCAPGRPEVVPSEGG
jgi:hypothetical protein